MNRKFVELVKGRYDASKKASAQNRCSNQLMELAKDMVKKGVIEDLIQLLDNNDDAVRYHAAFYLMPFAKEKALPVIEVLAKKKGKIIYWEAKDFLKDYNAGNFQFPHYNNK